MTEKDNPFNLRFVPKLPTLERCNYCTFFDYHENSLEGNCSKLKLRVRRTQVCDKYQYDWGDL